MPSNRALGRTPAQIATRVLRGEAVELYCKGYGPNQIMSHIAGLLVERGFAVGSNGHNQILRAVVSGCPRSGMPRIEDQLAMAAQFGPEDSPALEEPWWKRDL